MVIVVVAVAAAATFSDALFGAASFYRGTKAVSMGRKLFCVGVDVCLIAEKWG